MPLRARISAWTSRTFHPFSAIAAELQIIRELYELELGARTDHLGRPAPIYRVTEAPKRGDTEVTFAGEVSQEEDPWTVALDELED